VVSKYYSEILTILLVKTNTVVRALRLAYHREEKKSSNETPAFQQMCQEVV